MRRSSLASLTSVLAVLAAAGLAACGEEGPSREEFAQNLDRVCSDIEDQLEEIQMTDPESPREAVRVLERVSSQVDRGIERLKEVERPEGDAGEMGERFVQALERENREVLRPALRDLQEAIENRDEVQARSAIRRLQSIEDSESDRIAEELGADECAED